MFLIAVCLFAAVVVFFVIKAQRKGGSALTLIQQPAKADGRKDGMDFATLYALTDELSLTVFGLRQSLLALMPLIRSFFSHEEATAIESISSAVPAATIDAGATKLERNLASCQVICALIEPDYLEVTSTSGKFVSLLSRAQRSLSKIPWRMREERGVVSSARAELANAQLWMEKSSAALRAIPLSMRFADLKLKQ